MADKKVPVINIEPPDEDEPDRPKEPLISKSPKTSPKPALKSALKSGGTPKAGSPGGSPASSPNTSPKPAKKTALKVGGSPIKFKGVDGTEEEEEEEEEGLDRPGGRKGSTVRIGPSVVVHQEPEHEDEEEIAGQGKDTGEKQNLRNRRKSLADHLKEASSKFQSGMKPRFEDRSFNQMFIELDELKLGQNANFEWHEKARWIKYEENMQHGSERWSKPHVACLSFQSLIDLKNLMESGMVLLDMEEATLDELADRIAQDMLEEEMIDEDQKQQVKDTLMLPHQHQHVSQLTRRGSIFPTAARTSPMNRSPYTSKKMKEINDDYFKKNDLKEESPTPTKETPEVKLLSPYDAEDPDMANRVLQERRRLSMLSGELTRKLAEEAEAFSVMVGEVTYLDQPVCAFIRLDESRHFENMVEVPVPVRFMFVLLGPRDDSLDYVQIGRSMATIMSSLDFQQVAFESMGRKSIIRGVNKFLNDSLVLPAGEWDQETLLPIIDMAKQKAGEVRRKSMHPLAMQSILRQLSVDPFGDPLQRTGRAFGGMVNDVKRRFPLYLSDLKDGLNPQCIATFFFIYFACLAPAITFGGLMSTKVDRWMGVPEMLLATSVVGILFALLSAQPLKIIGVTGPMLLFEESLYQICDAVGLEYISTRVWVGIWIAIISVIVVAVDGSVLVRLITRFTEEIFSALISLLFIYETFFKLFMIFYNHPLQKYYPPPPYVPEDNSTTSNSSMLNSNDTEEMYQPKDKITDQPNTALLSVMLCLGTFSIAFYLKHFRNGTYLGRTARRALGDFGIPIAIVIMVLIDFLISDTYTEKLDVPDGLQPTAAEKRGWVINPMGMETPLPIWAIFAAAIPAVLGFILIFMESQITGVIVNKPDRRLKKGSGFHLDILLIGLFCVMNGFLGFPMMCAAAVRSISHVNSLSVFSRTHAPGEKPHLVHIYEQRITAVCVHLMVGISILLGPVLRLVPLAVLFGVFLYMGIASMSGVQFFDRLEMLFMPVKHHANENYVKQVRTWKMHVYTGIQVLCLGALWAIKSTKAALAFPFVLILMVPIRRYLLPKVFSKKELNALDCSGENNEEEKDQKEEDDDMDFYEESRMANVRQR